MNNDDLNIFWKVLIRVIILGSVITAFYCNRANGTELEARLDQLKKTPITSSYILNPIYDIPGRKPNFYITYNAGLYHT